MRRTGSCWRERGVGCVHNPSSNMMIASGVSPVPEMRAAGVAVGLGTDGPAGSNNDLDLMEEIDLAAKLAKISKMDPLALNAKSVVEMATIDGARALHMEKEIGSLEAGKKADLMLISLNEPNAVPMYDVYAQIAYSLKGSDVETVMIGGRVVMQNRNLLTVDEPQGARKGAGVWEVGEDVVGDGVEQAQAVGLQASDLGLQTSDLGRQAVRTRISSCRLSTMKFSLVILLLLHRESCVRRRRWRSRLMICR